MLILDPHEGWSRSQGHLAGGPTWDVVGNHQSHELLNHLKTFSQFVYDPSQELKQTFIRIPLRTKDQAAWSKIRPGKEVTVSDVRRNLDLFRHDIQGGDLLFLKYIRKITLRVDNEIIYTAEINDQQSEGKHPRQALPIDFLKLYDQPASSEGRGIERIFELSIQHTDKSDTWADRYMVSHLLKPSSYDQELDNWGRDIKLFPWVAVAAPLQVGKSPFQGRLFSTLSLNIPTQQTVHIHGLFATAPDRARLGFDDMSVRWNKFLFESCVANAWGQLLSYRNTKSPTAEGFRLWPKADLTHKMQDPWTLLCSWVIDFALSEQRSLWNATGKRCVSFQEALFTPENDDVSTYRETWIIINLPGVILQPQLFELLRQRAENHSLQPKLLTPKSIRNHLHKFTKVPDNFATSILEYCLLDAIRGRCTQEELGELCLDTINLPLWPMISGNLQTIPASYPALLPRDDQEMRLFHASRTQTTLAIDRFTPDVRSVMSKNLVYTKTIARFRTIEDLGLDWPNMYELAGPSAHASGSCLRHVAQDQMLSDIWAWIYDRTTTENQNLPPSIGHLWLIPLSNGRIRQLLPNNAVKPALFVGGNDLLSDLLSDPDLQEAASKAAIIDIDALGDKATEILKRFSTCMKNLRIAQPAHLDLLAEWLVSARDLLLKASDKQKNLVLKYLSTLIPANISENVSAAIANHIQQLPLFSKRTSSPPFQHWMTERTAIDQTDDAYMMPEALPALPKIDGLVFYAPCDSDEKNVVHKLELIKKKPLETLLDRHLLPWAASDKDPSLNPARLALIDWIFRQSRTPTQRWKVLISSRPIVPMPVKSGKRKFACLTELVDPESQYAKLFYEDEDVFPSQDFYSKHKLAALACGLGENAGRAIVPLDRARIYSQRLADDQLVKKVSCLLTVFPDQAVVEDDKQDLRRLEWFPAISPDGNLRRYAPDSCRDSGKHFLVDYVWGITDQRVPHEWQSLLGWNEDIPKEVLLHQLRYSITNNDVFRVKALLSHFKPEHYGTLREVPCILGSRNIFMLPAKVYYPGNALKFSPMAPYIDRVDPSFADSNTTILSALGVKAEPDIKDLQAVQAITCSSDQRILDEEHLKVAVASLEAASYLGYDSNHLRVPDTASILRNLANIVQGEPSISGKTADFNFTHPTLSMDLLDRLHVETCYERASRLDMDIEDEDDDEYAPREKLTNIISDTLDRYPVDTTFNEFLANANDAGAEQICWTVDRGLHRPYASQCLLTAELASFQGPSLMVYNDSVFSDKDFAGFKDIGQGGKQEDATTTGMFGRGAMTMYHFTDVPMLISGGFFLVLDPQQERLPRNQKTFKRKLGIKIPLSKVRHRAQDTLEPFNGMHGYHKDMDYFEGTIFRFPFRRPRQKTDLQDTVMHHDAQSTEHRLHNYLSVARSSLLFLHSVKLIEFRIRGESTPTWSISALRPERLETEVFRSVLISISQEQRKHCYDLWRTGLKDIESSPQNIQKSGKGSSKITECGIAACLQYGQTIKPGLDGHVVPTTSQGEKVQNKVFCRLPTSFVSEIPVSFHASFAITGDRKTIAFENQDPLASWNQWLLRDCIADFYVEFLRDAALRYGPDVFYFWPRKPSSSNGSLSAVVADSFWSKVINRKHLYDQLYPLSIIEGGETTDLRRPMSRRTRALHQVTALELAYFNTLSELHSLTLQPLFHKLSLNVVRPPPVISKQLKSVAKDVKFAELGPDSLSRVFMDEDKIKILEKHLAAMDTEKARADFYVIFLACIIPRIINNETDVLHKLQGCRIIPRPQLSLALGVLSFDKSKGSECHVIATRAEQELFKFASRFFVNTEIFEATTSYAAGPPFATRNTIVDLTNAGANIRSMGFEDIGIFLSQLDSPTRNAGSVQQYDRWLSDLWMYLNSKLREISINEDVKPGTHAVNTDNFLKQAGLWNQPVYRVINVHPNKFITPQTFADGPFVVEPDVEEHRQLIMKIPHLGLLSRNCIPFTLQERENNLQLAPSFSRFASALSRANRVIGSSVKTLTDDSLDDKLRSTLRILLVDFLTGYESESDVPNINILRCLPVWPKFKLSEYKGPSAYLAANEARFSVFHQMLADWVKGIERFVDPKIVTLHQKVLPVLGVKLLSVKELWEMIWNDLPKKLTGTIAEEQHFQLLQRLSASGVKTKLPVSPDGSGNLCKAESLYDHEEIVFTAAFEQEKATRFLHPDFRSLRHFFVANGLKVRDQRQLLKREDFVACAVAIGNKWNRNAPTGPYNQSASVVASYLEFEKEDFRGWPWSSWEQIVKQKLFRVKQSILEQPIYRQSRMQVLAEEQHHCTLHEAAKDADIRICWSRCKFLENPPALIVFTKRPTGDCPSLSTVFEHLKYLASIHENINQAEISEYLQDLKACYEHLQKFKYDAVNLPGIRSAKIWFNLDSTETTKIPKIQLGQRLLAAHLLCLDAPCK